MSKAFQSSTTVLENMSAGLSQRCHLAKQCALSYACPDCRSVDDHCGERTVGTYIKWRTSRNMVCSSQLQEARCQWSCFQSLTSGPRRPARRSAKFSVGSQALPVTHNSWEISQRYPKVNVRNTEATTTSICTPSGAPG